MRGCVEIETGKFVTIKWTDIRGSVRSIPFEAEHARSVAKALTEAADEIEQSAARDSTRAASESDGHSADESPSPKSPVWRPVSEAEALKEYLVYSHYSRARLVAYREVNRGDRSQWVSPTVGPLNWNPTHFTPIPEFDGGEVDQ